MLTYDLARRGKTPLYQYLYQCIRDDILSGAIAAEERLPSKRSLAAHLHVSVITVENAYRLLQIEGYVHSREKSGYFASKLRHRSWSDATDRRRPLVGGSAVAPERRYFADFSSNKVQTSLFPVTTMAKLVREMIALEDPSFLDTIPYNGTPVFRQAIAEHLRRFHGMDVDPDQVVVGCGTEYLYSRLMQLFPTSTVLGLEDPGNHKFAGIASRYAIPTRYVPMDRGGIRLGALAQSGAGLVHLSPANSFPLGSVMPISRRLDVLAWAYREDGRYLIEDDFDSEINSYGSVAMPVFHYDGRGRTVYLNTFAKTLLPSLRVAYMVLPEPLLRRYHDTTTFYSCTVSGSDQYVFSRFIRDGYFERHLNHLNTFFRTEQRLVLEALREVGLDERCRVIVPPAGTRVLLAFDGQLPPRDEMRARAEALDIRFALVSDYAEMPTDEMRRLLVLNYASVPPERLVEALRRLRVCVTPGAAVPLP